MITFKRTTTLHWVLAPTAFQAINQIALAVDFRPLSTSISSVNKMLSYGEEMEMLLPPILGITPNSNSTDWQQKLQNYWHNFNLDIPKTGMTFDISLVFDMSDYKRKEFIQSLANELGYNKAGKDGEVKVTKDIEKLLYKHIVENVKETELYKYMYPVNVENYLAWRYCTIYNKVANTPEDMRKSNNIDFYLLDEAKLVEQRDAANKLRTKAVKSFYDLLSTADAANTIENLLIADDMVLSMNDLKELLDSDREAKLLDLATQNPEKYFTLTTDKAIKDKAEIKKWEMAALIRKLPNTTIYVDASDPSVALGNNIDDVVGYINAEVNAAYVNTLRLKFKNINN